MQIADGGSITFHTWSSLCKLQKNFPADSLLMRPLQPQFLFFLRKRIKMKRSRWCQLACCWCRGAEWIIQFLYSCWMYSCECFKRSELYDACTEALKRCCFNKQSKNNVGYLWVRAKWTVPLLHVWVKTASQGQMDDLDTNKLQTKSTLVGAVVILSCSRC